MRNRKPKVFHGLVNYGAQAGHFSEALRKYGYEAKSITNIDVYARKTDFSFYQQKGYLRKFLYYRVIYPLIKIQCFLTYDIFHFYFGKTLFNNRLDLYLYKLFGKKVVMEYLGNDLRPHEKLVQKFDLKPPHPFTKNPSGHDERVSKRIAFERDKIDFKLVCLPIYFAHAKYYNLPIDGLLSLAVPLPDLIPYEVPKGETVIMHAPTSREFKGTIYYQQAVDELIQQGFKIRFEILENLSHDDLLLKISECHIFCDQISEGWYGTVAIEAMAMGKPTCAYMDDEWMEFCDFKDEIPIINTGPDNAADLIKKYISNNNLLLNCSKQSRIFVEKYHDIDSVTKELIKVYEKIWPHYYEN